MIRMRKVFLVKMLGKNINFHRITGHFGADDLQRIVTLCNKCAESGGKKSRSDKKVHVNCMHHMKSFIFSQTQTILKFLVENKVLGNEDEVCTMLSMDAYLYQSDQAVVGTWISNHFQVILPTMWASVLKHVPELEMPIKV